MELLTRVVPHVFLKVVIFKKTAVDSRDRCFFGVKDVVNAPPEKKGEIDRFCAKTDGKNRFSPSPMSIFSCWPVHRKIPRFSL